MFSQGDIPLTEVAQCAAPERHRNCVCQSKLIRFLFFDHLRMSVYLHIYSWIHSGNKYQRSTDTSVKLFALQALP